MPRNDLSKEAIRDRVHGYRPRRLPLPLFRCAAVLLPLFADDDGSTRLWLIRRPDDGTPHGGQIALPGGKPDPTDANLTHTALREASEEIGLDPETVEVFGALDDYATITRYRVTPYVGWITRPFTPKPNLAEAARVFHAPLGRFLRPADTHVVRVWRLSRPMPSYAIDGEVIWGATGTILRRFGEMLNQSV